MILTAPHQRTGRDHQGVPVSCGWTPFNEIWQPTTSHWTKQSTWLRTTLCAGWCLGMALCTPSGTCQKIRRPAHIYKQRLILKYIISSAVFCVLRATHLCSHWLYTALVTRQSRIANFIPVGNTLFASTAELCCVQWGMSVSSRHSSKGQSWSTEAPPLSALPLAQLTSIGLMANNVSHNITHTLCDIIYHIIYHTVIRERLSHGHR